MKNKHFKAFVTLITICTLALSAVGCDSNSTTPSEIVAAPSEDTETPDETPDPQTPQDETDTDPAAPEETGESRWHVLSPEVAAAVDADFCGDIWKIDTDTFYVAETYIELLDDGSIATGSPASDANVPDSDLIQVVFDETTHFYLRTVSASGGTHEDTEATFQTLELHMPAEMKGSFENDVFHATEIRLIKVI